MRYSALFYFIIARIIALHQLANRIFLQNFVPLQDQWLSWDVVKWSLLLSAALMRDPGTSLALLSLPLHNANPILLV